jgi:predicted amidohydrolase YtcJ
MPADLVLHNGRITTLDKRQPEVAALAIQDGRILATGSDQDVMAHVSPTTKRIDLRQRRAIPGLIDSHTHLIRGGLTYNLELRWDGVRSLATAMEMLKAQVARTPPPEWVRVVGGFYDQQFAEKRLPTLEELNAVAPDTPVFILHVYDRALLNGAALRACGYTKDTPEPPGGEIARDGNGNPTGLLIAKPNATILYATLGKGPKLPPDYQKNSTLHFMREMNRLGVTGVIDAGGGSQRFPEDYQIIEELHKAGELTMRFAYNLFTQRPRQELEDFSKWSDGMKAGSGDDVYRLNGAGEMLVYSAADFEDFRQPRPEMPPNMEADLTPIVRVLAERRWPFRLHATYDETIARALDVFEAVNREVPLQGLHWFFDHAETVTDRNLERIAKLGGGIAVQHRMAYQGEYFVERYGAHAAERTPPIKRMLEMAIPVSAGTDATRVASYNPWVALAWLVTGKTFAGTRIYPQANCQDRETALRLWTERGTWFSNEEGKKGQLVPGQLADIAVLSQDYFHVPEDEISHITSVLTLLGGRVVHGTDGYDDLAPALPQPMPDWSPVRTYGGYQDQRPTARIAASGVVHRHTGACEVNARGFWGPAGCSCWAF